MNIEECSKCKGDLEFTTNVDNGDSTGQDEYYCEKCNCEIVYAYKKQYSEPTRWELWITTINLHLDLINP